MTAGQVMKAIKYNLTRGYRLTHILRSLRMPKSTYYFWKYHQPTKHDKRDQVLSRDLTSAWYSSHKIYGFLRLAEQLRRDDTPIGAKRFWRLCREIGLYSVMKKKRAKPCTHTDYPQRPNLIKHHDWSGAWCGDITYIRMTNGQWVYLASVYNPNDHKVVAYKISSRMTDQLVTDVMKMALKTTSSDQQPKIMHTDMGSQYTSYSFEQYLLRHHILHSYSKKGYPYDKLISRIFTQF